MKEPRTDIASQDDVKLMVDSFYDRVTEDDLLATVFNDFAKTDWDSHLPKMYRFWNSLLFGTGEYKGNPFAQHIPLPVDKTHFERWLQIFTENIDDLFEGKMTESAKSRAGAIACAFQSKLEFLHHESSEGGSK